MSGTPTRKKLASVINLAKRDPAVRGEPLATVREREAAIAADRNAFVNMAAETAAKRVLERVRDPSVPMSTAVALTAIELSQLALSLRDAADMIDKRAKVAAEKAMAAHQASATVRLNSFSITDAETAA